MFQGINNKYGALNNLISINLDHYTIALLVIFFPAENLFNTQFKFDKIGKHLFENIGFLMVITLLICFGLPLLLTELNGYTNIGLFHYIEMRFGYR
jgi:hypothetical protein